MHETMTTGRYELVDKLRLKLDYDSYQRTNKTSVRSFANRNKIVRGIVDDFRWELFGCLHVFDRGAQGLWVYDGGHRLAAAMEVQGITKVPCMIFASVSIPREADAFVEINTRKTSLHSVDRHKAALCSGDPIATAAQDIMERSKYAPSKSHGNSVRNIRCLKLLYQITEKDRALASDAFALGAKIADGREIHNSLLKGLFFAAVSMRDDGLDMFDARYTEKLINAGWSGIRKAMNARAEIFGSLNISACAMGVIDVLNHKRGRNRIAYHSSDHRMDINRHGI